MLKRSLLMWLVAAVTASALLASVLVWQHRRAETRWSTFMVGSPHTGSLLFEREGCVHCHSINGFGGKLAPDLGYTGQPESGMNTLVTAMWNHAPKMWDRMRAEKLVYPDLGNEEMAHLFAFLYTARYADEPGDQNKGQTIFQKKGCVRCHSINGGNGIGPDLAATKGIDTPIRWTEAMWNHVPEMKETAQRMGITWPHFEDHEMNDLLAYIRANSTAMRRESELLPADPERGWKVFQAKSCSVCHSVNGQGGHVGPELGPNHNRPFTVVQFSGLMWNHSPDIWKVPDGTAVPRVTFQGQEIADLVAFLSTLQFFEPTGSQRIGEAIFTERGCDTCHGTQAEGSKRGPALRGGSHPKTTITLAAALWRHGPKMFQKMQQIGHPWPMLQEGDVGNLVAFLNSSTAGKN